MKGTVLIVEDYIDHALDVAEALEHEFQATAVYNASHALDLLSRAPFDVVVSDYYLPDGDGLQVLDKATKRWPDTSGILLTGASEDPAVLKAQREGKYLVLLKPFRREHLLAWVEGNAAATKLCRLVKALADSMGDSRG